MWVPTEGRCGVFCIGAPRRRGENSFLILLSPSIRSKTEREESNDSAVMYAVFFFFHYYLFRVGKL